MFCAKCGKELPAGAIVCPYCATPVPGATPAPPPSSRSETLSGFDTLTKDSKAQSYWLDRVIAFIIDAVIVYVPLAILTAIIFFFDFAMGLFSPFAFFTLYALFGVVGVGGWLIFIWALVFILYNAAMESSSGASIGKGIFHLKVVSKPGAKPTFGGAVIRNLSKIYWLLLILDVIVGLAVSKGYNQKYSDHFLGTSVVHA